MFCIKCGKRNPDDAEFCAWCGARMTAAEDDELPLRIEEPDMDDPEIRRAKIEARMAQEAYDSSNDEDAPFRRPRDTEKLVRPVADNPAQPSKNKEDSGDGAGIWKPNERKKSRDGGLKESEIPRRRPVIAPTPSKKELARSARTIVPKRKRGGDLFLESADGDDDYDEMIRRSDNGHRIRSAVCAVLLLGILGFAFWLMVLPGGALFRARMGLKAPAEAYVELAEQYTGEGSISLAAEAYHRALIAEPDNYGYAYATASAMARAKERTRAIDAYLYCIKNWPKQSQPYLEVAELYLEAGEKDIATRALSQGYSATGVSALRERYEALMSEDER